MLTNDVWLAICDQDADVLCDQCIRIRIVQVYHRPLRFEDLKPCVRDRMAVTAARYLHERPAGTGKKGAAAEAAREAANGWDGDLASGDWHE